MRNTAKYDDTENIEMEKQIQAKMNSTKFVFAILIKGKINFEPKKNLGERMP